MDNLARLLKRVLVLLVVIVLLGLVFYIFLRGDQEIDKSPPIPVFEELEIIKISLVEAKRNDYDLVFRVKNPNSEYGAREARYAAAFVDISGDIIKVVDSTFYILPNQTKYVVLSPIKLGTGAVSVDVVVTRVEWQELDELIARGAQLRVDSPNLSASQQPGVYAQANATIFNKSDLRLSEIDVVAVIIDPLGDIVGSGRAKQYSLAPQSPRGIDLFWYTPLPIGLESLLVAIEASANVFSDVAFERSFIKVYDDRPFQKF